jgi:hypothetical protein
MTKKIFTSKKLPNAHQRDKRITSIVIKQFTINKYIDGIRVETTSYYPFMNDRNFTIYEKQNWIDNYTKAYSRIYPNATIMSEVINNA